MEGERSPLQLQDFWRATSKIIIGFLIPFVDKFIQMFFMSIYVIKLYSHIPLLFLEEIPPINPFDWFAVFYVFYLHKPPYFSKNSFLNYLLRFLYWLPFSPKFHKISASKWSFFTLKLRPADRLCRTIKWFPKTKVLKDNQELVTCLGCSQESQPNEIW